MKFPLFKTPASGIRHRLSALLLAASLLALFAAPRAHAQFLPDTRTYTLWGTTNNFGASTVRQSTNIINVARARNIAFAVTTQSASGATSNAIVVIDSSLDQAHWKLASHNVNAAVAGTTLTTTITNFDVGGIPYLRIREIQNTNTAILTNVTITTVIKTGL